MPDPLAVWPVEVADDLDAYRIVDVREPSEFEGPLGHVSGSENVPMGQLEQRMDALAAGAPLLLVCRSGNRSGRACKALAARGIAAPTNLLGGMIEWNHQRLPVERRRLDDPESVLEALAVWMSQVRRMTAEEATAFVHARLPGGPMGARTGPAVARAVSEVVDALCACDDAPADAEIVAMVLRCDLARLVSGLEAP
jgi:rhodanese-related sulfurtransferase